MLAKWSAFKLPDPSGVVKFNEDLILHNSIVKSKSRKAAVGKIALMFSVNFSNHGIASMGSLSKVFSNFKLKCALKTRFIVA